MNLLTIKTGLKKELANIESRQKEIVWLLALLQNTLFDQENKKSSDEIGIKDKIDDEIEDYVYKYDIQYR